MGYAAGRSGGPGGADVAFQPDRRPAVAAIVPKRPTQASLNSPRGCDLIRGYMSIVS